MLLHLAIKAFSPCRMPFSLLHVDTTWKFRDMIAFRDATAQTAGTRPDRPYQRGRPQGGRQSDRLRFGAAHPRDEDARRSSRRWTVTASTPRSAARAATRKRAAPRSGCFRCARPATAGTRARSVRNSGTSSTPALARAKACGCFRCPIGPNSTSGSTSPLKTSRSCRFILPLNGRSWNVTAPGSWSTTNACRLSPASSRNCGASGSGRSAATRLSGGIESDAATVEDIIAELRESRFSERQGRLIDHDSAASMERKKKEGYF